jgi:uncharacterized membrane protein YphA (DoxX/SURF4 family)
VARRNRPHRLEAKTPPVVLIAPAKSAPDQSWFYPKRLAQAWSPTAARLALGLVLLWFGLHELVQPSLWTGYVPVIPQASQFAIGLVLCHGWLLSVLGVALVLGVAPQLAAGMSALMLLEIVLSLSFTGGVSDIVARDLGVFGLAVAVFASDRQKLVLRD